MSPFLFPLGGSKDAGTNDNSLSFFEFERLLALNWSPGCAASEVLSREGGFTTLSIRS
jgi:hypothetical protein